MIKILKLSLGLFMILVMVGCSPKTSNVENGNTNNSTTETTNSSEETSNAPVEILDPTGMDAKTILEKIIELNEDIIPEERNIATSDDGSSPMLATMISSGVTLGMHKQESYTSYAYMIANKQTDEGFEDYNLTVIKFDPTSETYQEDQEIFNQLINGHSTEEYSVVQMQLFDENELIVEMAKKNFVPILENTVYYRDDETFILAAGIHGKEMLSKCFTDIDIKNFYPVEEK